MKKSNPQTYSVKVNDTIQARDKIDTYKRWFNGMKHFYTVKILPPYNNDPLPF